MHFATNIAILIKTVKSPYPSSFELAFSGTLA